MLPCIVFRLIDTNQICLFSNPSKFNHSTCVVLEKPFYSLPSIANWALFGFKKVCTVSDMAQYQIFVQYQYQYFQEFCFQNQYQYQNSSNNFFNIKIKINIKIFPPSISKSISKFFKTQNQYQN